MKNSKGSVHMKKYHRCISLLLTFSLLVASLCVSASAAGTEVPYTFDGMEMSWCLCDEEGNVVQRSNSMARVTYNDDVDIPNGYTLFFYANSNQDFFDLEEGTPMEFMVKWSSSAIYIMGYDVGSKGNGTTRLYSNITAGANTSYTKSFDIPNSASYVFWVTNMSTDTKTLTKAVVANT